MHRATIRPQRRREQLLHMLVLRLCKHGRCGSRLDEPSLLQHQQAFRPACNDAEVVRNQK